MLLEVTFKYLENASLQLTILWHFGEIKNLSFCAKNLSEKHFLLPLV